MKISITLPLPHSILSQNSRVMSRKGVLFRAGVTKKYRTLARQRMTAAMNAAKLKGGIFPWPEASVRLHFYFGTRRNRDRDNFEARMKSARDGMADAGIVTNDRYFRLEEPVMDYDKENPRVEIEITRKEVKP